MGVFSGVAVTSTTGGNVGVGGTVGVAVIQEPMSGSGLGLRGCRIKLRGRRR